MIDRRTMLRGLALTALGGSLPVGAARRALAATEPAARHKLPPVRVSRDRVLRTIVGLRPFRRAGFVVRAERRGDRLIVHNYGHGGAGVTLSWGTSQLAVDELVRAAPATKSVAVLGCGAVGLASARLLQQRGIAATIYARDLPPHTTSDVAGARWYPFDLFDRKVVTAEHLATLWRVSRVSYDAFRKLDPAIYGIRDCPTYACRNTPFPRESLLNFDSPVAALLPGLRDLTPIESPFSYPIVRHFQTMMIEPAIYLPAVMRDFKAAGGRIVERDFKSAAELDALPERVVVNCTGMGARALFGDEELMPIKGQLTILRPQPEVGYVTLPPDLYMFPRRDGIVLGGTFERNVWGMEVNLAAEERILQGHARFFAQLGG